MTTQKLVDSKTSGTNGKNIFGDIFDNNFSDFWNTSTTFGKILDMNETHFLTKFYSSSLYDLTVINIQTNFQEEVNFDFYLVIYYLSHCYSIAWDRL